MTNSETTILALMAHPDDAEILCGATLAHLHARGWTVHIASAAMGDCGTETLSREKIAAIRRQEGEAAARVLGGEFHCLGQRDLLVRYDEEALIAACGLLREVRPRILITHNPTDYMLDHEQTSLIARAAAFNAPIPNAPAPADSIPITGIPHLYYADPVEGKDPLGRAVRPSLLVDASATLKTKLEMLACHESQREWLRKHHGMDEYLESTRRWGEARGAPGGFASGEGFRQHLGHAYPQDDLLFEILRDVAVTLGDPPDTP